MTKKISLSDIIKSRYGSEDNLPEWVERRRAICNGCEWNSANKPKKKQTTQEKAWVLANHGKPTCLACKCMLSAKTKLPHAVCGLTSIGEEPKWGDVGHIGKTGSLEVHNISTTPLGIENDGKEIWLHYGTIKIGQETDVQLLIKDVDNNMTDISASASCGCTVPKLEKKGNEITLKINYDTKRVGEFTKTVVLSYRKNNMDFEKIFKITGKTE